MQRIFWFDAVHSSVRCGPRVEFGVVKNSVRISVNSKLLLNRNKLERVFYMKKLRLVDIFPAAYHLNHSDKRFIKIHEKTAAATRRPSHHFQN